MRFFRYFDRVLRITSTANILKWMREEETTKKNLEQPFFKMLHNIPDKKVWQNLPLHSAGVHTGGDMPLCRYVVGLSSLRTIPLFTLPTLKRISPFLGFTEVSH